MENRFFTGKTGIYSIVCPAVLILVGLLSLPVSCGRAAVGSHSCDSQKSDKYMVMVEEYDAPEHVAFTGVSFDGSGTGYGVTPVFKKGKGYDGRMFGLLKTDDRGRTWERIGYRKGNCREMTTYGDCIYFVVYYYGADDPLSPTSSEILKCCPAEKYRLKCVARFDGTVYKLHIFNDSTFVCGMNPETVSVPHSLMITTDSGRTWNEIGVPGKFVDSSIKITYSENCLFASLYGAEYEHALFVKNVITGQERVFEFRRDLHSIVASEGIFTTHPEMRFWQFDGETMKPISVFQWNPDWGYGSYYPRHLFRRGELVIGMAEQFPGKEGKRRCVFGSTDGGCHWEPFVTGDDISIIMAQIGDTAAEVSSDNSISVFFLRNGRINVLTLKKMYSEKTERKNSGNQEKEVFDLLFGKLTDYYEENVPGFSLPEINGESIVD